MDQINPLLLITDICRQLHVGHSLISNKVSPCLIPLINRVISKCNALATLVYPDGISKLQFIDALTFDFLTVEVDLSSSQALQPSESHAMSIYCEKIYQRNGITVTIQQQNNPDAVEVQKAW